MSALATRWLGLIEQEYEVRDWTKTLGCTDEQLREAVKAVGNSADEVGEYLKK